MIRPGSPRPGWFVLVAGSPPRSPRAGPVLAVDTSGPVDISELAATLTRLFSTNAGT